MNCTYCQIQFDQTSHVPRLLIFCGHSLCQKCCRQLHINNRIQCPECFSNTFIQQVNFLPKNLALLKVNSNSSNGSNPDNHTYCLKHEKKYEAFCKKQKILICVDCILHDNHRNHEMDSIKNAHVTEQANLKQSIQSFQNLLNLTQLKYEENLGNEKQFIDSHDINCENLNNYFQQLKQLIQKQQDLLLNKVKEQYESTIVKFQQKNFKFITKIQELSVNLATLKNASRLSQIQFLSHVNQRQQIIGNVNLHTQQTIKCLNSNHSKNSIGDLITKSIQKNFKVATQNTVQSGSKTPQITKTKKLSNHQTNQQPQYQSIKPYQSLQIPTNQNLKPMAKKISKKDPIPVSSSATGMVSAKNHSNLVMPLNKACVNVQHDKKTFAHHKPRLSDKQKFDIGKNCDISIVQQKQSLFNSFFSNMTSFLNEQKFIYVIGGFDQQNSNMIRLNLNTLIWEQVSHLKAPRSKFGCVSMGKNIYMIGGKKGRERVSDIEIWNNGNWNYDCNLKKKRSGFGIICYQHFIYIIGGNDGQNILNSVEILNTQNGQWMKGQPLMEPRDQLAVCMGKDHKIYALGGFGGKNNEPLKTVQMYDIKMQKWFKVPSLHIQRRALAAASLADGIYAIGGFDGTKHLNSVEKYEQGSSEWIHIADLKRGRCTHTAISIFDTQEIIVMGGFDQQALDSVQKYSLITNQWEQIAKMPSPRFMHSCILFSQ